MHKRESGRWALTATWANEEEAQEVNEWIQENFGSDTAAVKYCIRQQMQRDMVGEDNE